MWYVLYAAAIGNIKLFMRLVDFYAISTIYATSISTILKILLLLANCRKIEQLEVLIQQSIS